MLSSEKFCYWLKGFFELYDGDNLTDFQLNRIKQELDKVFTYPEPPIPIINSPPPPYYVPSIPQITC